MCQTCHKHPAAKQYRFSNLNSLSGMSSRAAMSSLATQNCLLLHDGLLARVCSVCTAAEIDSHVAWRLSNIMAADSLCSATCCGSSSEKPGTGTRQLQDRATMVSILADRVLSYNEATRDRCAHHQGYCKRGWVMCLYVEEICGCHVWLVNLLSHPANSCGIAGA